jgi:hypothetical protein
MTTSLYRAHPGADWIECEVVARHASGKLVLREVKLALPGVFLGEDAGIRVPVIGLDGIALIKLDEAA